MHNDYRIRPTAAVLRKQEANTRLGICIIDKLEPLLHNVSIAVVSGPSIDSSEGDTATDVCECVDYIHIMYVTVNNEYHERVESAAVA